MIQPVLKGEALLQDFKRTLLGQGQVAVWWLGQSGYALKTRSLLWYVDLYLSEHLTHKYADTPKPHIRMTEAPLHGGDLREVTWVFASHKHSDHLDPETLPALFSANPTACLVLPAALIPHAEGLGLPRPRLFGLRGDDTLTLGELTIHAIPAAHPTFDYDPATGYPFLGFVFQIDGLTLYHSGDTLAYEGLAELLRPFQIDLAFLPINGAQAAGTPPNMNAAEALALAQAAHIRCVVPCHYDMFTFNTVDVRDFEALAQAAGQPYAVLQCGEKWLYRKQATLTGQLVTV
jgi:L-ascorbate metabolism protein UlaG (beta-lactamase superfamily)